MWSQAVDTPERLMYLIMKKQSHYQKHEIQKLERKMSVLQCDWETHGEDTVS